MDKRFDQIEKSRKNITRFCRWLSWAFNVFFAGYCLAVAGVTFFAIFPLPGFSYVGPDSMLAFLPIVCNVFAGGLALFLVAQMLRTVGKGLSPFSLSCSRQIQVLAVMLLIGVVAGAFIAPGAQVGSVSESGAMVFDFPGASKNDMYTMHIDLKGLFLSIICFALSPIFRYGALLQSEADDLM